jgi:hypothetical protein
MKINQVITEKSVSQQQQKFMGMVYAAKKGEKPASPAVAKTAAGMSKSDAKDFAKTKHKGLPKKVEEATGDPLGTVSTAPDASGKVKIKTPTGTEIETTKDALLPGAKPGTVQMKPDAAGDALKPGTQVVSAEAMGDSSTMPTTEYVKGIYAAAAENGMGAPDIEAVRKQMVLAANGEVDIMATMQKSLQVFQDPKFKQMLADLDTLIKQAEKQPNAELSRIQELAGVRSEDQVSPRFAGVQQTKHADGSQTTDYQQGPLQTTNKVDAQGRPITSKSSYELGVAKVDTELDHKSGIRSNAVTTPGMDPNELLPTADIAAARGADPKKFAAFQKQNPAAVKESPELTAMLNIAGLR